MDIPDEIRGADAVRFANEHLEKVRSDPRKWTTDYIDKSDGSKWLMDYPESGNHGGGSPRLRRLSNGSHK